MTVVARLYARRHIGHLATLTVYEQVVSQLDAVPVLVAIHSVVAADGCCDSANSRLVDILLQVSNKALTCPGIRITTVHKAMQIAIPDAILLSDVDEFQQMAE